MSDKATQVTSLTLSDCARRGFLKTLGMIAAGESLMSLERVSGHTLMHEQGRAATKCRELEAPMKDVVGKVAFITGGSSGIGLGIARAFADAGMKVAIGYRTPQHRDEALDQLESAKDRVHAIQVDVTDRPGIEKAAAETVNVFGKIHVLVGNAGVINAAPLSQTSYEEWDWLMNVNLNGVFNAVKAFLPHIQTHDDGGHIITTSSVLGLFVGDAAAGAYCISKFALVGLMEALRAELLNTKIGVSLFCPGVVRSNLGDSSRNRPTGKAGGSAGRESTQDAAKVVGAKEPANSSPIPSDPLEAGRLVLRGMRNNDLYILTHPEFARVIQLRHEALMASMSLDVHPTEARLAMVQSMVKGSIYSLERERQRCLGQLPHRF